MDKFDTISVRGFAKQIGKSHVWVLKLIDKGVIPRNKDGTIPLEAALKAHAKYDAENGKKSVSKKKTVQEVSPEIPEITSNESGEKSVSLNAAINKVTLAEKTYKAKLKEIEYKSRTEELLEKSDVEREAQWLAEQVKSKLMAIPPRISSLCEGRIARDIEEIITDAINDALKELQKCKYLDNGG